MLEGLITPIVIFFLFGGGAIAVIIIIVREFRKKPSIDKEPGKVATFFKWAIVVLLSFGQVSCLMLMGNFNAAFGGGGRSDLGDFVGVLLFIIAIVFAIHYVIKLIVSRKMGDINTNYHQDDD